MKLFYYIKYLYYVTLAFEKTFKNNRLNLVKKIKSHLRDVSALRDTLGQNVSLCNTIFLKS